MFVLIAFTQQHLKWVNTAGGEEPSGARTQLHSSLSISNTSNKASPEYGLVLKSQRRLQSWLLKINQIPCLWIQIYKTMYIYNLNINKPSHWTYLWETHFACKLLRKQSRGFLTSALQTTAWLQPSLQHSLSANHASAIQLFPEMATNRCRAHFLWTATRNSLAPNHLDGL